MAGITDEALGENAVHQGGCMKLELREAKAVTRAGFRTTETIDQQSTYTD